MSMNELEALSRVFAEMLFGILLRLSVLVLISTFVILFFRSKSAEFRHFIWRSALYGLLVLPVLQLTAPPVRPATEILVRTETALFPAHLRNEVNRSVSFKSTPVIAPAHNKGPFPWMFCASAGYLFVANFFLLRLLLNFFRLKTILQRSEPLIDPDAKKLWHDIWLRSLCPWKPRIRVSSDVCVPMTIGLNEVSILLPASWKLWSPDKLQAALIHEMAHARRTDPATYSPSAGLPCRCAPIANEETSRAGLFTTPMYGTKP